MFCLAGKKTMVVGGASGIGEAVARAFRVQQAEVMIADVNHSGATALAAEIGAAAVAMDVSRCDSVQAAMDETVARFGGIDVVVNSAGIMHIGALHETDLDDFDRIQRVNCRGTFLTCRAAAMHMLRQRRGNLINIASVAGLVAVGNRFAYCVSKGAVVEMTRSIAIDYANCGIRANAICPGTIDTPMIRNYVHQHFSSDIDATWASLRERQPVGRLGEPEEVAALAVYLASDESSFVTGAAIAIDGGWTAK